MALKIIILSFLFTSAFAGPHANTPLKQNLQLHTRVIGGQDAEAGEFPYQASLQGGNNEKSLEHFCGGVIIADNWILTAAHCTIDAGRYKTFLVKVGKHDISKVEDTEQMRYVEKRFKHELYPNLPPQHMPSEEVAPYDIGLLKLKTPLKLNKRVSIVKLPKAGIEPHGQATISGWGSTSRSNKDKYPNILQKVKVPIFDRAVCNDSLHAINLYLPLHETNVCTGPMTGGFGSCRGDSGGPLTAETKNGKEVVGLASWVVYPCGNANGPSVFTKVSDFIDWISNIIAEN